MTVAATPAKAGPYVCDGVQTDFPFAFRALEASHIAVYIGDEQVTTGFTVELAETGGTVRFTIAPGSGKSLAILRATPFDQQTDIQDNQAFLPEIVETALDKLTMLVQQLKEELSRCVKIAVASGEKPESVIAMILGAKDMALDSASTAASAAAACSSAQLTIATIWSEITGNSASAEAAIEALREAWEAAGSVSAAAEAGKASVNEASLAAVEYAKGQIQESQEASIGVLSATTKSRKEELLALIAETVGAEGTVAAAVAAAQEAKEAAEAETGKIETISAAAQTSISAAVATADQKRQQAQAAATEAAAQAEQAGDSAAEAYSYIASTLANRNAAEAAKAAAEAAKADAQAAAGSASEAANASVTAHDASLNAHPSGFAKLTTTGADAVRMKYGGYGVLLRNDGGSFHLLLTNANDADGVWNSLRPLSIHMDTGKLDSNGVSTYNGIVFSKQLILSGLDSSILGETVFKDKNDVNVGVLRVWQASDGRKEIGMFINDSMGANGGYISFVANGGIYYSYMSVCNGFDTEIARCDWVKNQISANISKSPGYPNYSGAVDLTSAYVSGWTADRTGWLYFKPKYTSVGIWINGALVSRKEDTTFASWFGPIRSGNRIVATSGYTSYDESKAAAAVEIMIFFPNV